MTMLLGIYDQIIGPEFVEPFVSVVYAGIDAAQMTADALSDSVNWAHRKVTYSIDLHLSPVYAIIAKRIVAALPEVLFCAAALTEVGVTPATLFWTYRLITAFTPVFKSILKGEVSINSLTMATRDSISNLGENYRRLTPAIALVFALAGSVSSAYGLAYAIYESSIKGVVYFAIGGIALKDIWPTEEEIRVQQRVQADLLQAL